MVNAFVTDINPYTCAESHSNLMLARMALETAEVLAASRWNFIIPRNVNTKDYTGKKPVPPYHRSKGQRGHPLVLWVNKERINFHWLYHYGIGLIKEYHRQYPDKPPLKCERVYHWLRDNDRPNLWPEATIHSYIDMTFNVAINDDYMKIMNKLYKSQKNVKMYDPHYINPFHIVDVYRLYFLYKYLYVYKRNHSWGNRRPPSWMTFGYLRNTIESVYGEPTTPTSKNDLIAEIPF